MAYRLLLPISLLLSAAAIAQTQTVQMTPAPPDAIDLPLLSADPAKPLELLGDGSYSREDLLIQRNGWHKVDLTSFTYDASKGPVTLVVDFVATRPAQSEGEAILEMGIECEPQCPIPILQSVMGFKTDWMAETTVNIEGKPSPVWVGRESHAYAFEPGAGVNVWLSLSAPTNLEPRLIRARLFYGNHDPTPLYGAPSRAGLFLKIALVVAVLLGIALWFLKGRD